MLILLYSQQNYNGSSCSNKQDFNYERTVETIPMFISNLGDNGMPREINAEFQNGITGTCIFTNKFAFIIVNLFHNAIFLGRILSQLIFTVCSFLITKQCKIVHSCPEVSNVEAKAFLANERFQKWI